MEDGFTHKFCGRPEIYFGFTINADGQEISISFEGFWDESEMEGAVYFREFGSGEWYATRK